MEGPTAVLDLSEKPVRILNYNQKIQLFVLYKNTKTGKLLNQLNCRMRFIFKNFEIIEHLIDSYI